MFLCIDPASVHSSVMSAAANRDSQGSGLEDSPPPTSGTERNKREVQCIVKLLDGEILHFDVQVRPCGLCGSDERPCHLLPLP